MDRRRFLSLSVLLGGGALAGCRGTQFAAVRSPDKSDMVGSHKAGAETFKPLVEQAVGDLLARHSTVVMPASAQVTSTNQLPPPPTAKRICFVAVENKSVEEIGDFKDQIYQIIDLHIVNSQVFQPVSKRFVDAGLAETRLRPDQLMVPNNMRAFIMAMEHQSQPFDYLLYATLTSGTTSENKNYQRDYLLTLEMVDIHTGQADKQAATLSKGYYQSRVGRWMSNVGMKN